jgi:hypothetical protein
LQFLRRPEPVPLSLFRFAKSTVRKIGGAMVCAVELIEQSIVQTLTC